MCWSLILFTATALMGAELLLIYTNINKTRIMPRKSPRRKLTMRRKGKSSTLRQPHQPRGIPSLNHTLYDSCQSSGKTAACYVWILTIMKKNISLPQRIYKVSVWGRATSSHGQKKRSGKNNSSFLINQINFLYTWNKSAYFIDKRGFFY